MSCFSKRCVSSTRVASNLRPLSSHELTRFKHFVACRGVGNHSGLRCSHSGPDAEYWHVPCGRSHGPNLRIRTVFPKCLESSLDGPLSTKAGHRKGCLGQILHRTSNWCLGGVVHKGAVGRTFSRLYIGVSRFVSQFRQLGSDWLARC